MIAGKIFAKPWAKGAMFGFIFGVLLAAVSVFELFHGSALESVPQFLGALPAFIVLNLLPDVSQVFAPLIYFIYWIGLGALVGWAISKGKAGKGAAIILIVALFFSHLKAHITLQREFGSALEAFTEFLRILGQPFPPSE